MIGETKKKKKVDSDDSFLEKKEVSIVTEPAHSEVTQRDNGHIEISEVAEKKSLQVKAGVIINPSLFDSPIAEDVASVESGVVVEQESLTPVVEPVVTNEKPIISVPKEFDIWFTSTPHQGISVRKAYNLIDELETSDPEVFSWVNENEDMFAEIWLGETYKIKVIPLYETTIPNKGKRPNMLVKEGDGGIVLKPYALLCDEDVTELTEVEIREDWAYLFENGLSRITNADEI